MMWSKVPTIIHFLPYISRILIHLTKIGNVIIIVASANSLHKDEQRYKPTPNMAAATVTQLFSESNEVSNHSIYDRYQSSTCKLEYPFI